MLKSNINQFLKETKKDIEKELEKQESQGRDIILEAYRNINRLSPASTGFFRANNLISINTKFNKTIIPEDEKSNQIGFYKPLANEIYEENRERLKKLKFKTAKTITIENSVSYAEALESGKSKIARNGIYGVTEERIRGLLSRKVNI